jgi:hypothetical protein
MLDRADVPYTKEERLVAAELFLRRGRQNAVSIARLKRATGMSERAIKGAVESLIERQRLLIGSSRMPPFGYYMISTGEEIEDTCRALRNQALKMLRRVHALQGRDKVRLRKLLGQMELEIAS